MTPDGTFATAIDTPQGTWILGLYGETLLRQHRDGGAGSRFISVHDTIYVQGIEGNLQWYQWVGDTHWEPSADPPSGGEEGDRIVLPDGEWSLGPQHETYFTRHMGEGWSRGFCLYQGILYAQGMAGNNWWYVWRDTYWTSFGPEAPISRPPPSVALARLGRVQAQGRVFVDDSGPFRPLGATLFWALYGWKYERDRVRDNLAWLSTRGIDYVRILGQVGWADEVIDPGWLDYTDLLSDFVVTAYIEFGLRTELTCIGGGGSFVTSQLGSKIVAALSQREAMVLHLEVVNEYFATWGNSAAKLRPLAEMLRALPILLAPSAPPEPQLLSLRTLMETGPYTMAVVHKQRQEGDRDWRFVRQNWDFKDEPWPTSNNEPKGPLSSVAPCADPLRLAMDRAVGILCGIGAYVLHNGNGIYGRPNDNTGGGHRNANVWELDNADAIYAGVAGVAALIPDGVENWINTNDHWAPPNPVHPLYAAPTEFWETGRGDHGVNKNYGAIGGRQFVCMPCGVLQQVTLTARYACQIKVYHPLTREMVLQRVVTAGEMVTLSGDPLADTAYIIVGDFI